jgi:hypothetical protein
MAFVSRPVLASLRRAKHLGRAGRAFALSALAACLFSSNSAAQSAPPGLSVEAEGQLVFGASDVEVGMVPSSFFSPTGPLLKLDEGQGWGGAIAVAYGWGNGWNAFLRFRRLDTDDSGGAVDPGIVAFAPGVPFGGSPVPLLAATTKVDSKTSIVDFLGGRTVAVNSGTLQLLGGLTYVDIDRDTKLYDGCSCVPAGVAMGSDFHGIGPKIGFRGDLPLNGSVRLVGGASAAALFGTSTFSSALFLGSQTEYPFKHSDDRVAAALDAEAGLAVALGAGTLMIGYRIDAVLNALDTDQRVSAGMGLPEIGDKHGDLVEHGPFARFALPLGSGAN